MRGEELLTELLGLVGRQSLALASGDLGEVQRLGERRAALQAAVPEAEWSDREAAKSLARELLALDARNEAVLRWQVTGAARELAEMHQGAVALRDYRSLAGAGRPTSVLLDRLA